jgi:putative tryptophan/tyrosine transport system substrate-binding protein
MIYPAIRRIAFLGLLSAAGATAPAALAEYSGPQRTDRPAVTQDVRPTPPKVKKSSARESAVAAEKVAAEKAAAEKAAAEKLAAEKAAAEKAAAPTYQSWFKFGPSVTEEWAVNAVPNDPMQVVIRRLRSPGSKELRKIFVLYPRPSSAYDVAITKVLDVFADKDLNAEFRVVNFNNEDERAKAAIRLAETGKHQLILSMGSEATAWLWDNYRGRSIPVVSVCSKDPVQLGQLKDYERGSNTNFAFTSLNMPLDVQMAYVQELKPKLRNIAVLVDSKNISAVQTQAEPIFEYAKHRGIQVLNVAVQDPKQAREELETLVPQAVAQMRKNDPDLSNSLFWITGSTAVFREIATINRGADRVPVVSVVPEVVAAGNDSAVLSVGVSFESNAHLAAIYAADVLSGRVRTGELKAGIVSPPDIAINYRKAREIGLRIPFRFFEIATHIYDYDGRMVRANGRNVRVN